MDAQELPKEGTGSGRVGLVLFIQKRKGGKWKNWS